VTEAEPRGVPRRVSVAAGASDFAQPYSIILFCIFCSRIATEREF
jgi:hypothetical protein